MELVLIKKVSINPLTLHTKFGHQCLVDVFQTEPSKQRVHVMLVVLYTQIGLNFKNSQSGVNIKLVMHVKTTS